MKLLIVITLVTFVVAACSTKEKAGGLAPDERLCREASERLIAQFGRNLKSELLSALQAGGPASAVSVCSELAPRLADSATGSKFVTVRRISEKNRNPVNAADSSQLAVLRQLANQPASPPATYGNWTGDSTGRKFFYYKAITTAPLCLQCHGSPNQIDDDVRAILNEKYPNDRAVGYVAGEFRGAFLVEITWPDARPYLATLLNDDSPQTE